MDLGANAVGEREEGRGQIVRNAQPALARWAANAAANETDPNRLFLAEEKEALGVLEGLRAFGLMTNERETKR